MEKRPSHSSFSASSTGGGSGQASSPLLASKLRALARADSARLAVSALALLMGLTVLGVSASTLSVYDATKLPAAMRQSPASAALPGLWPTEFNIGPTVALVVGSVFVVLANAVGLAGVKVKAMRDSKAIHTSTLFAAPAVGFIAAAVGVFFFYGVNANDGVDTFTSWTCRWKGVPMGVQPRWDTLCSQSWAGVYLSVLLIPVEAVALGVASWRARLEKGVEAVVGGQEK